MISNDQIAVIADADVYSMDDDKIGSVQQVYLDDDTNQPAWVTVKTGFFGSNVSFIPIESATWDNTVLRVPFDKDYVKNSPDMDPDRPLDRDEEARLYEYYGLGYGSADAEHTYAGTESSSGGDAMTRSEEHVSVDTETREAGRARLRKYVVTEQQTVNVPVSHEEVRLEREPITDANVGDAYEGLDITESEHEVVLHEERPVVTTETKPVERVRLATDTVTDTETVTADVRKEQIEVEGDARHSDDAPVANEPNRA